MQRVLASLVLLEGLAIAQPTPDQAAHAKQLFEDGRKLAGDSKWQQACDTFARSYALDPAIGTELNIGDCEEHLGHLAIAWHMFDDAAKKDTDADRIKYAHGRAATLAPKLAAVTIKLPDPGVVGLVVKVAGNPVPPAAEITTMVDPGSIAIEVAAPGRAVETRSLDAAAGQTLAVDFGSAASPPPPPHDDTEPATVSVEHRQHHRVVIAETIGALGAAGMVTGVTLGFVARSKYNTAIHDHCTGGDMPVCDGPGYTSANNAITLANVGTVFFVAGAAAAIAGGVVFLTAPKEFVVTPTASGQGAGISISGTF